MFKSLGLETETHALYWFPRTYEDRRHLPTLASLTASAIVSVRVSIKSVTHESPKPKTTITKCVLSDQTGVILGIWFNQPYLKKLFKPTQKLIVKGKLDFNTYTQEKQLIVSDFELLPAKSDPSDSAIFTPIYPLSRGTYQTQLRRYIKTLLYTHLPMIKDPLPDALRRSLNLMSLSNAITYMHFPPDQAHYQSARTRIVFDEFFYLQLAMAKRLTLTQTLNPGIPLTTQGPLVEAHLKNLPYTLTPSQQSVIQDIAQDIQNGISMNRLVQGDVGSGKTDIAAISILMAIQSGYNAALMAPTEILAVQHYLKLSAYFSKLAIPVYLLKGKMKKKERDLTLANLTSPTPYLLIGTHSLIEEPVQIPRLAMVIVDEQHRFGVMQRQTLKQKANAPHCLFLTATPIPRSLMLTAYGDLEKSIIAHLPPGRSPIKTLFFKENRMAQVYDFCQKSIQSGHQVYIVYPLVEESEKLDLQAAIEAYESLRTGPFSTVSVGLIHGKLTPIQKQDIMAQFKAGDIQVLVATTVIEVGIDVPNATIIIIVHAERFGLSQLHQLRGRVGRGSAQSHCFLIANPKSDPSKQRIQAMLDTTDGFKIAEYDLKIRGPGDMLGTRQAGLPDFKVANLITDQPILLTAKKTAFELIKQDPSLSLPHHHLLKTTLQTTHGHFIGALN